MNNAQLAEQGLTSFEEIGRRLGISYQAAQRHYHKGMVKLRKLFREKPDLALIFWLYLHQNDRQEMRSLRNRGVHLPDYALPDEFPDE